MDLVYECFSIYLFWKNGLNNNQNIKWGGSICIKYQWPVSYPRRIWNCLWKQCTKLRGNTRRTSWIVKDVHSFQSDSCESNLATLKRLYIQRFYAFLSQNLILGGNYRKSYRKSIYRPFSNYRSNYRYRFNTSLNYRWF